jgi:hypothetical protein
MVVTMVANYLTTQLPAQMQLNDANRGLSVENQVSRLAASLRAAAASERVGAVVSEPVSLGSLGAPPFAAGDGASIGPGSPGAAETVSFTVNGASAYTPPEAGHVGGHSSGSGICTTPTATSFSDTGSCEVVWNFTGNSKSFSFGETGSGFIAVNVTTNNSTIMVTGTGSAGDDYQIIGSHNSITMTGVGSGPTTVTIVGSYNTLSLSTTGSSPIVVYIYGNHDPMTVSSTGSGPFKGVVYGTQDTLSVPSDTGSQKFRLYLNGFNATAPTSPLCPYGNLSATDNVTEFNEVGSGGLTEYINNSVGYNASGTGAGSCVGNATCWTTHNQNVPLTTCPFFTRVTIPQTQSGAVGASLVVHLRNTYAPAADVAFDQGAVVYAQSNGRPLLLVGPAITYTGGTLALWVPEFLGTVGAEAGDGTAELSARLVSVVSLHLPSDGFSISGTISIKVTTPYAAAWESYFGAIPALAADVSPCFPATSIACAGPFGFNGPLGTVYLNVTAKALAFQVATYAVTLG